MAVPRPDRDDVAALARSYGLQHTDAETDTYALLVAGSFDAYEAVEQLYEAIRPEPPTDRPVTWPSEADNPLGAWYVRTEIRGADDGPLAGRTVAIKDNTAVAGVPMMNGSRTLEGFVPDARRDGGHPAAGRRRDDRRQGGLRGPLLLRRQPHLAPPGPVRNPWDPTRHDRRQLQRQRRAGRGR